eukprot:gene6235-7470_t
MKVYRNVSKSTSHVLVADLDTSTTLQPNMLNTIHLEYLQNSVDSTDAVICSHGIHTEVQGRYVYYNHYDTYPLVMMNGDWAHALYTNIFRRNSLTSMINATDRKMEVQSCFGGAALYPYRLWFAPACSYTELSPDFTRNYSTKMEDEGKVPIWAEKSKKAITQSETHTDTSENTEPDDDEIEKITLFVESKEYKLFQEHYYNQLCSFEHDERYSGIKMTGKKEEIDEKQTSNQILEASIVTYFLLRWDYPETVKKYLLVYLDLAKKFCKTENIINNFMEKMDKSE